MTISNPLSAALAQLSFAQDITEKGPRIYSEKTWSLISEALELAQEAADLGIFEENTPPAER